MRICQPQGQSLVMTKGLEDVDIQLRHKRVQAWASKLNCIAATSPDFYTKWHFWQWSKTFLRFDQFFRSPSLQKRIFFIVGRKKCFILFSSQFFAKLFFQQSGKTGSCCLKILNSSDEWKIVKSDWGSIALADGSKGTSAKYTEFPLSFGQVNPHSSVDKSSRFTPSSHGCKSEYQDFSSVGYKEEFLRLSTHPPNSSKILHQSLTLKYSFRASHS